MTKDKWITQYRKGIYELAILMLLSKKDMYGYGISKELKKTKVLSIAGGAIYPILNRLHEKGWIISYIDKKEKGKGPERKYYKITSDGMLVLEQRNNDFNKLNVAIQSLIEEGK
ncbi:PadR family transcriptional regulator [Shouchella clausii]|jgi:PadR family transcriptional regulator, regulatory protein PadR|uniref:PadR family transcriptional regulator n=1 Tax=Shouchella clausii TaxID=79880 RepID=UPI000BA5369A|nr:PadR family transcriptional regulator [Shouchella clausii]MDO7267031.1 PadR family transcriptional regulator [Shouchella clausii]MDO7286054.1 PadR family transcriptional regulator [Shouchella clausii]PAE95985.1 hypothetical protein CHH70_02800 [Shouchella clausii]